MTFRTSHIEGSSTDSPILSRISRSLVSWHEIPARVMLPRGDRIRFAHAMATTARQLAMAESQLVRAGHANPGIVTPDRVAAMFRLHSPEDAATAAEQLVEEMLAALRISAVTEAGSAFGRWLGDGPDAPGLDAIETMARSIFERAQPYGAVAAVLADSWARGFADSASDVDIRILVADIPTLGERTEIVGTAAGDGPVRQYGDEAYITADQFVALGQKIDVKYHSLARMRATAASRFDLGGPIDLLELLGVHRPVADPAGAFSDTVTAFASQRRDRTLEIAHVSLEAAEQIGAGTDPATLLGPGLEYVARAWAGINNEVHAFPKWMDRVSADFEFGPPGGIDRLNQLCGEDWTAAQPAHEWRALVADLETLRLRTDQRR